MFSFRRKPPPASPSGHEREERLDRLAKETFDLLIVGGGITGAAIARDATLRGLSVALIDKGDFASGTSSRSSKLVHGGLRYLKGRHVKVSLALARGKKNYDRREDIKRREADREVAQASRGRARMTE